MLKQLRLERFKSFKDAHLPIGPLTLLCGTNASGKSNLRDAFRFLHGIGSGYTLAEIFGEKHYAGQRQWAGIRGGSREASFRQEPSFALELTLLDPREAGTEDIKYRIEVITGHDGTPPRVQAESLFRGTTPVFEAHAIDSAEGVKHAGRLLSQKLVLTDPEGPEMVVLLPRLQAPNNVRGLVLEPVLPARANRPVLSQLAVSTEEVRSWTQIRAAFRPRATDPGDSAQDSPAEIRHSMFMGRLGAHILTESPVENGAMDVQHLERALQTLSESVYEPLVATRDACQSMRFLELVPEEMHNPSEPGQLTLSDRGENLSSVLQGICAKPDGKANLIRWLRLLTPMDVVDLTFPADLRGQVLLSLVEQDGSTVSAYSASDGTLRFLGMLAALLSREPPGLLFLEEVETGLHPARLRLLIELLRESTQKGQTQIVASTHSPQILALLDDATLKDTALVFRLEGERGSKIRRIWDLPDAPRILTSHDRQRLLASGWFENVVEFAAIPQEQPGEAQVR